MKSVLSLAALLFFSSLQAQQIRVTKISDGVYVHTSFKELGSGLFPSNGLVVETSESVVLIDTPWDIPQTEQLIDWIRRNIGKPVSVCVATHSHDDRVSGIPLLEKSFKTTLITHRLTSQKLNQSGSSAVKIFDRSYTFTGGGVTFELYYPGKGHTADNIVVWLTGPKILFGGCFVKSTESAGLGNIADADLKRWPRSLRKVQKRYPHRAIVIPGHQGWDSTESIENTLKLLAANSTK
jgi:metallo-beta-lactamase class B